MLLSCLTLSLCAPGPASAYESIAPHWLEELGAQSDIALAGGTSGLDKDLIDVTIPDAKAPELQITAGEWIRQHAKAMLSEDEDEDAHAKLWQGQNDFLW